MIDINFKYHNNILHLEFPNQYELCSSMMRIQEFYESPSHKIFRKRFSIQDCMDEYATRHGNFTYFTDHLGFNIPGSVLQKFYETFTNFTNKEDIIFNILQCILNIGDCYLIATSKLDREGYFEHEMAHACYYMDTMYWEQVNEMNARLFEDDEKYYNNLCIGLEKGGYREDMFQDEINAYLSTSTNRELVDMFGDTIAKHKKHSNQYKKAFLHIQKEWL
jgi:hypothetical protein